MADSEPPPLSAAGPGVPAAPAHSSAPWGGARHLAQSGTLLLRPVHSNDVDTLAELLVQLYGAEEPGVLRSPREGQLSLFRHILAHELAVTTGGRFLAVDAAGVPLGSASMRLYGDSIPSTLPSSLLVTALRQVGFADTLRFFGYLLRSSLASETVLRRRECYIYSVVVDAGARRRGVGYAMMEQLEAYARRAGVNAALLRVMEGNEPARQLYRRLGYRRVSGSAAFARWLGMPSELMRKELV